MGIPILLPRRVRDSNPRYDVMRIPHFECGSFDHSDNSPRTFTAKKRAKVQQFFELTKYFGKKMLFCLYFVKTGPKDTTYIGN